MGGRVGGRPCGDIVGARRAFGLTKINRRRRRRRMIPIERLLAR